MALTSPGLIVFLYGLVDGWLKPLTTNRFGFQPLALALIPHRPTTVEVDVCFGAKNAWLFGAQPPLLYDRVAMFFSVAFSGRTCKHTP